MNRISIRTPSCYNMQLKKKELDHEDDQEEIPDNLGDSFNIPYSTEPQKKREKRDYSQEK